VFVIAQLPIADARILLDDTGRLTTPPWPNTNAGKDFVRSLGSVQKRLRGGADAWFDESTYCDARRALRFVPAGGPPPIQLAGGSVRFACAFRRYFSDGRIAIRIEVGISTRMSRSVKRPLHGDGLADLVRSVMGIPVVVGDRAAAKPRSLAHSGDDLADFLLACTTRLKPPVATQPWWLTSGEPIFLAEYRADEVASLPPGRRIENSPILESAHVDVSFATISLSKTVDLGTWLLGIHPHSDWDKVRLLRIHLLRLHAQREVLRQLIRLMGAGKIDAASDDSQRYLDAAFSFLSAERKGGVEQPELLAAAYQSDRLVAPGDRDALLSALEEARRQVRKKVEAGLQSEPSSERVRIIPVGT
jgi:hypothetical protein